MKKLMMAVVAACAALGAMAATTADYVQDGLVACWDGWENDGAGGHATELTEWRDTKGEYSFVFNANSGITVDGASLVFSGASGCCATLNAAGTAATFDLAKNGTMEIVFKAAANQPATCHLLQSSTTSGISAGCYASQTKWIVSNKSSPCPVFDGRGGYTTLAVRYANGVASEPYVNAASVKTDGSNSWSNPDATTYLGARAGKSSLFKGEICAIRLYSTPLTPEQIAANRAVDVRRFVKGDIYGDSVYSEGFPQNYAVADSPTYGAVEQSDGDAVGLTAPEYVELSADERAYCTGWKLYDGATDELVAESTDETRTRCEFTYEKPVRLVWQWDLRYPVTVSAAAGLTVTPESAWASAAAPAEFTVAGADVPYWSGEGLLGDPRAKTVAVAPTAATEISVKAADVREPTDIEGLKVAIASSADGDVVILPDGTNSFADVTQVEMTNELAITKAVLVTSRSGDPKDVTVDLGGTGWGFTLNAAGARLRGITFTSSVAIRENSGTHPLPRFVNVVTGTVDTCVFRDFNVTGNQYGGFAPLRLYANGVITDCLFTNIGNTVSWPSAPYGTVYASGGLITRTKFCKCDTFQAPVCAVGALTVEDSLFTGHTQTSGGMGPYAGIYTSSPVTVRRTVFADNVDGSGVLYYGTSGTTPSKFEDCVFTNNVASGGPGIYGFSDKACFIFDRCAMLDNKGSSYGIGGLGNWNTQTFRNCLIRGNTGTSTAGVVYGGNKSAASCKFENCTVTGNKTVSGSTPGIDISGCGKENGTSLWVKNCIVWGNGTSPNDPQLSADAAKVSSSCYPEAVSGNDRGNISLDPYLNADGTLQYTSPCLDVALDLASTAGATDLVGTVRPQDATGKGAVWDMGCFEMPPNEEPLLVSVSIDQTVGASPATVTATATVAGAKTTGLTYDWTIVCTAPNVSTNTVKGWPEATYAFENLGPGAYEVFVTVRNDSGDSAFAKCDQGFSAKPAVCYVSKTGSATWPYDEPAKATLVLADAIASAAERVEIDAGEYDIATMGTMTDPISGGKYLMAVTEPIEVRGAGSDRTKFTLDGATAAIYVANANALVGGFTVAGAGRTDASFSGSSVRVGPGVVSNVVVRDGAVWGSAVHVGSGGLFTCGVVTNMTRYSNKDDCKPVSLNCGTVSDTLIAGNVSVGYGAIAVLSPSAAVRAQVRRVKVVGNQALNGPCGLWAYYPVDVFDTDFVGNKSGSGAVISTSGSSPYSGNFTLTNCRITGNSIYNCDGAVDAKSWSTFKLFNVLVADNVGVAGTSTAACRGITAAQYCAVTLRNCTVTGNETPHAANAGISTVATSDAGSKKSFVNCIFWGNCGTTGEGSADFGVVGTDGITIKNCCWPEATEEGGCTSGDPKLRAVKRYRYYPSPSGSCYEAGDATGWTEADVDLAGNPRLRDGKVDIGCYQVVPLPGFMLMLK